MFPFAYAYLNSSAGVSFEVNITCLPLMPLIAESISSGRLEQSAPQPSLARIFMIYGFGQAFTA